MTRTSFLKNNLPYILLVFLCIILSIFFLPESLERTLVVLLLLIGSLILLFYTKNSILSSTLFLLFVLPLNITFQLPESVSIFGTELILSNPYVNGVYVNYLVPTIALTDLALLLFCFASFTSRRKILIKKISIQYLWYAVPLIIFLLLQNILIFSPLHLLNTLRIFLIIFAIFCFLFTFPWNEAKKRLNLFLLSVSFGIISQGVLGTLQFLRGSSVGLSFLGESQVVSGMQGSSFVELGGQLFLRAYGTFPHPNLLGGYLLLVFLFLIVLEKYLKGRKKYFVYILFALILIFAIFTFSRIVLLLLFLSLMLFLVSKFRLIKATNLYSFTPTLLLERFTNLLISKDNSLADRLNLLRVSIHVLKENILLGTGVGSYVPSMGEDVPRTVKGILLLQPVHNIFILLLSELGIVGFFATTLFVFRLFVLNVKNITTYSILILLCVFIIGMFDHYLVSLPQGLTLLLLFLLLFFFESKGLKQYEDNVDED